MLYSRQETEVIGVVADEASVFTADDCVHRADLPGSLGQFAAEGDHGLLIGDGYIDGGKVAVF